MARLVAQIRLEGHTQHVFNTAYNRVLVVGAVFVAAFLVISVRLAEVALVRDGDEPRLALAIETSALKTNRADIRDRTGQLLATSVPTASLYANPRRVLDAAEAATKLVKIFPDLSEPALRAKLESDRSFVWIRRHLSPKQQFAVNRLGLPGLEFQREERRVYPYGALTAHIVGMTDIDDKGLAGIEHYFDEELRTHGETYALSIDVRVQHVLTTELARAMTTFQAVGAAGIVMNVKTGEVVALVSLPSFDPNEPNGVSDEARFNRISLGVYEMGSTFKIFTTAMALESGVTNIAGGYDAREPIRVARFVIRDYHAKRRWLSVPEIFIYSSNIGSAKMALDVGGAYQRAFLARLGMLHSMPIELSEVGAPLAPQTWREINTMTIAYGHGLAVSPLHLASGVAAIVNGGIYHAPTLMRRDPDARLEGRRVVSAKTSEEIRRLLRLVVEQGTGKNANAEGYLVGGKTGTAEKVGRHGYQAKSLLSSFVGVFPMNDPQYVVLAMIDEPQGTKETHGFATGGWVAAPVVGAVVRRAAPFLGVAPVDENAPELRRNLLVNFESKPQKVSRVAAN